MPGSLRRKPLHSYQNQFKKKGIYAGEARTTLQNASVNSRLLNPRPLNNLSKNMSIDEENAGDGAMPNLSTNF